MPLVTVFCVTLHVSAVTAQVQIGVHLARTLPPTTTLPTPVPVTQVIRLTRTVIASKSRVLLDATPARTHRATVVFLVSTMPP